MTLPYGGVALSSLADKERGSFFVFNYLYNTACMFESQSAFLTD